MRKGPADLAHTADGRGRTTERAMAEERTSRRKKPGARRMARYVNTPHGRKKRQRSRCLAGIPQHSLPGAAGEPAAHSHSVIGLDDLRRGLDDEDLLRAVRIDLHDPVQKDP